MDLDSGADYEKLRPLSPFSVQILFISTDHLPPISMPDLPHTIENEQQLEEVLATPRDDVIDAASRISGNLLILGAGGKMGPSLCSLAQKAIQAAGSKAQVVAVSRFRNSQVRDWLRHQGVGILSCDLSDRASVARLPDSNYVIYLVGMKFGTSQNPAETWAVNTLIPDAVASRFPGSRIVALSTGNVYPMSPIDRPSRETDPLTPIGEYANAAVARERIFEFHSLRSSTPMALVRLNYAHDLRYGVVTDIASRVWHQQPVDLTMGYFNAIWQGDANRVVLRCLDFCNSPPFVLNVTSPEIWSVRETANTIGLELGRQPIFQSQESTTALLSDTSRMIETIGAPTVDPDTLIRWVADWTKRNQRTLNKPTHYDTRDGKY